MLQDLANNRPFALLDPHGDLSETIADASPIRPCTLTRSTPRMSSVSTHCTKYRYATAPKSPRTSFHLSNICGPTLGAPASNTFCSTVSGCCLITAPHFSPFHYFSPAPITGSNFSTIRQTHSSLRFGSMSLPNTMTGSAPKPSHHSKTKSDSSPTTQHSGQSSDSRPRLTWGG